MDDADKATDLIEKQITVQISTAIAKSAICPKLDCFSCSGITQSTAKHSCSDFQACVGDWLKLEKIKKIKGKVNARI